MSGRTEGYIKVYGNEVDVQDIKNKINNIEKFEHIEEVFILTELSEDGEIEMSEDNNEMFFYFYGGAGIPSEIITGVSKFYSNLLFEISDTYEHQEIYRSFLLNGELLRFWTISYEIFTEDDADYIYEETAFNEVFDLKERMFSQYEDVVNVRIESNKWLKNKLKELK